MGLLIDLVKNIGAGIGSVPGAIGNGLIDMFGTSIASARDLGSMITTGKDAGETAKWKMYRTGAKNERDASLKMAGRALNGASSLADLALMIGTGGTSKALTTGLKGVAMNGAQGFIGGAANELAEHGEKYNIDRALNRSIAGAITGAVTSGVGNKMSKAIANDSNNKILNNFITRNNIGRGAAMGALGGGISGAMMADANNQNVIGGALSGIGSGALMGGAMSGALSLGTKAGVRLANKIDDGYSAAVNKKAMDRLANGLEFGADGNIKFVRMDKTLFRDINNVRVANGLDPLDYRQVTAYKNAVNNNLNNRVKEGMAPNDVAKIAYNSLTNSSAEAFMGKGTNQLVMSPYNEEKYSGTVLGKAQDGGTSLKSIEPRDVSMVNRLKIEKIGQNDLSGSPLVGNQERGVVYNGSNTSNISISDQRPGLTGTLQGTRDSIISQNQNNVNTINDTFVTDGITPIEKRNKFQKIGNSLKQSAKNTKYSDVYSSLYPKTADKAAENNTLERLSKLGVAPQDYKEYAKTSSYVNGVVDKLAEKSKVYVQDPDLISKLSLDNHGGALQDHVATKYNNVIKNIVPDGKNPGEYSASYLLKTSRKLGKMAEQAHRTPELSEAYIRAKYVLRDAATDALEKNYITGDDTTARIANGLKELGANQKIIDYYSEPSNGKAPSVADYIRRTSLFEEGRTIGRQMESNKLRRSASETPTGVAKTLLNAAGLMGPLETLAKNTVSPIAGGITHVVGGGVGGVGNALSKANKKFVNHQTLSSLAKSVSVNPEVLPHFYNVVGRTAGGTIANNYQNNIDKQIEEKIQADEKAKKEAYENRPMYKLGNGSLVDIDMVAKAYINAQNAGDKMAMAELNSIGKSLYSAAQNGIKGTINVIQNNNPGNKGQSIKSELQMLGRAAFQAGDMKAFAQAVQLYKMAEAMYGNDEKEETKRLSETEKKTLHGLQNSLDTLDQMEELLEKAGGAQGILDGNLQNFANFATNGAANYNLTSYNSMRDSLGMAIIKNLVNLGATEQDAKRYAAMLPTVTSSKTQAKQAFDTIRKLLQKSQQSVYNLPK